MKHGCGRIGFRADHEDEYGDVAIDMVLNAYERVLKEWPHHDRRHRIEHCSLINPDLISRIKANRFDSYTVLDLHPLSRREMARVL